MLNDEICKMRDKLNKSIEDGAEYKEIYNISIELDKLIAKFYNRNNNMEKNTKKIFKSIDFLK